MRQPHVVIVLAHLLGQIDEHDTDYPEREQLVYRAIHVAQMAGYAVGFRRDPTEPEWPVAYIRLPEGQVSWHMPQFPDEWDGHDVFEKYQRIARFRRRVTGRNDKEGSEGGNGSEKGAVPGSGPGPDRDGPVPVA